MDASNNNEDQYLVPEFLKFGQKVYSNDFIEQKRNQKPRDPYFIAPQKGGQEELLLSEAQIIIFGGIRGAGKSGGLLLGPYNYIDSPYFSGAIFRKEKDDAKKVGGIIDQSYKFYSGIGGYNKAEQDRTWYFKKGGKLNFGYYSDNYTDFITRYQGLEVSYIGIDEITHMKYPYFKYLLTCNRNSTGQINKIIGTCNPDPDSWVAHFIGGDFTIGNRADGSPITRRKWIKEDGYPDPEMSGKILYCYMWGERVDQIYWGETKEAVYEQAKDKIDDIWDEDLSQYGSKLDMFIIPVTFIMGVLKENRILLESDPSYFKNLAQQSDERRLRDLKGNWLYKSSGEGLLSPDDIENLFSNSYQCDNTYYMTADIAITTDGDNAVIYIWNGFHIEDVEVYRVNSTELPTYMASIMEKYDIAEENLCYDAVGIGKYLEGYFNKAIPFIGNASPTDKTEMGYGIVKRKMSRYENLRAQCIDLFCDRIKAKGYSINTQILNRKILNKRLCDHIREEYPCLRRDFTDMNKFKIISKPEMKAIIGHSPDFIDAYYMREYFELIKKNKQTKQQIGAYLL